MQIAIATFGERVSPRFDCAPTFETKQMCSLIAATGAAGIASDVKIRDAVAVVGSVTGAVMEAAAAEGRVPDVQLRQCFGDKCAACGAVFRLPKDIVMTRCIFGPVPSRRLGRSLGIDLVPFKTCSYDCIYCQLGRTTCKTRERKDWVPLKRVIAELESRLSSKPDYITLSGSGEPTLHSRVGELIARIKALTDIPVAVLTNGSLLWLADMRRELLRADLVVPSLDAGDETMFRVVNRPDRQISFEKMLDGLVAFRQEFPGQYWLEVMVIGGLTATSAEIAKLADCVNRIQPDRVQLNTVTRPPAEEHAAPVSFEQLDEFCALFPPPAEVIADFRGVHQEPEFAGGRQEVLTMLQRRPCSVQDIAHGLGMHQNEVLKYVEELSTQGAVDISTNGNKCYYKAVR